MIPSMGPIDPRSIGERRTGPDRKKTQEEEAAVVRDYRANHKLRDIEKDHGISRWTVYAILARHGLSPARYKNAPASTSDEG